MNRSVAFVALGAEEARLLRYLRRLSSPWNRGAVPSASGSLGHPGGGPNVEFWVHERAALGDERTFERIADCLADLFPRVDGLVVAAPCGVVVRSIAPLLVSKYDDPAVVVVDALGRHAISLLSGHEGGANDLAWEVARLLRGEAVITTTTEAVRSLVVGLGCRRGTPAAVIEAAVDEALALVGATRAEVRCFATVARKEMEPGLLATAAAWERPLRVFDEWELERWSGEPSVFVSETLGIGAVAEPAAMRAGTRTTCKLKKTVLRPGVTVSIAEELLPWLASDLATPSIAPAEPNR